MNLSRRKFIQSISSASLVLWGGSVLKLSAADAAGLAKKSTFRFVVASDGHYGQEGTDYKAFYETLIGHINTFHGKSPLEFCVINGDIIHDAPDMLAPAKAMLDKLPVKYYVTKGNHDIVSDSVWNETWGMPVNHDIVINGNAILLGNTSNEKGEFLSPDLGWLKGALTKHTDKKNVFIFVHIPQAKWTKFGIETPAFFDIIKEHKNVRGVFHGHEHEEDGVKMVNNVPFMFDSHFGGNWGTPYKGFRVVELVNDNSFLTYIMNPTEKINQASF